MAPTPTPSASALHPRREPTVGSTAAPLWAKAAWSRRTPKVLHTTVDLSAGSSMECGGLTPPSLLAERATRPLPPTTTCGRPRSGVRAASDGGPIRASEGGTGVKPPAMLGEPWGPDPPVAQHAGGGAFPGRQPRGDPTAAPPPQASSPRRLCRRPTRLASHALRRRARRSVAGGSVLREVLAA